MEAVDIRKITVAEFHKMEFDDNDPYLYELLDGEIVKKKAPRPRHQRITRDLTIKLHLFAIEHKLGEVLPSPIDVFLDDTNSPQPDLVFISNEKSSLVTDDGVMGVPDLIVEVISPSSIYRDRVTKKALFEQFGVQEYWIVDPADNFIEIYALTDGHYGLLSAASVEEGQLTSGVLPGLALDLNTLFAE
jgi:Uma2 family endonuclease